jgi:hypothetical protein
MAPLQSSAYGCAQTAYPKKGHSAENPPIVRLVRVVGVVFRMSDIGPVRVHDSLRLGGRSRGEDRYHGVSRMDGLLDGLQEIILYTAIVRLD